MTAIADRQPAVKRLRHADPSARAVARTQGIGLWRVTYRGRDGARADVLVEDRTGDVLEPSPWAWPVVSAKMSAFKWKVEVGCLLLALLFLALFVDFRRPVSLGNLDVIAVVAIGASLAFYDRAEPLVSVPLAYPPLVYLCGRLLVAGFRGVRRQRVRADAIPERVLVVGLVALVAVRIAFNLALGETTDVGYASVLGANSIHHGWPLYSSALNHLNTYGPVTYVAYLPFELLFPMGGGWQHDYLPAAHAAAITFDVLTIVGLLALGRRLRPGPAGRRIGLTLALGWAACPFTFLTLAISTNDGLLPVFIVLALVALASPRMRGALLGLAVAAKFAPLALAGALAPGRGDRRPKQLAAFGLAAAAVVVAAGWAYLPAGGIGVLWDNTLGFQMHRHSFLSLWGQYPQLHPLQQLIQLAAAGLAAAAFALPRRRSTVQVAALCGAVLIALQLSLIHWFYTYVVWFLPLVLVGLVAVPEGEEARAPGAVEETAGAARPAIGVA